MEEQKDALRLHGWRDARVWKRGVLMVVLAILFGVAQGVLGVVALLQFLWMLATGRANQELAAFGDDLGKWLAITARYQSGRSEHLPFPWSRWGA